LNISQVVSNNFHYAGNAVGTLGLFEKTIFSAYSGSTSP